MQDSMARTKRTKRIENSDGSSFWVQVSELSDRTPNTAGTPGDSVTGGSEERVKVAPSNAFVDLVGQQLAPSEEEGSAPSGRGESDSSDSESESSSSSRLSPSSEERHSRLHEAAATSKIKDKLEAANKKNQELEKTVKSLRDELQPLKNIAHKAESLQKSLSKVKERLEKQDAAITEELKAKAETEKMALAQAMMEDSANIMKMTWSTLFPKGNYAEWDSKFTACTEEYNRRIMQQAADEDEKEEEEEEEAASSSSSEDEEMVDQPTEADGPKDPAPENESNKEDALKDSAPIIELDQAAVNSEAPPNV
ncbi:ESF1 homolog [Chenopodium quinoa]|uniref:ESF1 homolog n=1 Tax=Chenopodium quinoa TaxID=63459 RepID=UPI000B77B3CD|nr:ESF1 homolog [Chenopodium quinoa]